MNPHMTPSPNCAAITKEFEGCKLKAYKCPADKWTIGYGHTGPDVHDGLEITQERAEELLMIDLQVACKAVNAYVTRQVNQNQFDALTDFAYNAGGGNLMNSTLLKKVNEGDFEGASMEFARWNKAGGKELPGLTRRRAAEAALFSKE